MAHLLCQETHGRHPRRRAEPDHRPSTASTIRCSRGGDPTRSRPARTSMHMTCRVERVGGADSCTWRYEGAARAPHGSRRPGPSSLVRAARCVRRRARARSIRIVAPGGKQGPKRNLHRWPQAARSSSDGRHRAADRRPRVARAARTRARAVASRRVPGKRAPPSRSIRPWHAVTGIGGVFLKSKGDADALARWYSKNLGIKLEARGGAISSGPTTTPRTRPDRVARGEARRRLVPRPVHDQLPRRRHGGADRAVEGRRRRDRQGSRLGRERQVRVGDRSRGNRSSSGNRSTRARTRRSSRAFSAKHRFVQANAARHASAPHGGDRVGATSSVRGRVRRDGQGRSRVSQRAGAAGRAEAPAREPEPATVRPPALEQARFLARQRGRRRDCGGGSAGTPARSRRDRDRRTPRPRAEPCIKRSKRRRATISAAMRTRPAARGARRAQLRGERRVAREALELAHGIGRE
jgi:hypothetical protein